MRYFKDAEGNLYTTDNLRYEYESFIDTLEEGDPYEGMPFADWIEEWFVSGYDVTEITKEEYET